MSNIWWGLEGGDGGAPGDQQHLRPIGAGLGAKQDIAWHTVARQCTNSNKQVGRANPSREVILRRLSLHFVSDVRYLSKLDRSRHDQNLPKACNAGSAAAADWCATIGSPDAGNVRCAGVACPGYGGRKPLVWLPGLPESQQQQQQQGRRKNQKKQPPGSGDGREKSQTALVQLEAMPVPPTLTHNYDRGVREVFEAVEYCKCPAVAPALSR
jgi:hypothetical protein